TTVHSLRELCRLRLLISFSLRVEIEVGRMSFAPTDRSDGRTLKAFSQQLTGVAVVVIKRHYSTHLSDHTVGHAAQLHNLRLAAPAKYDTPPRLLELIRLSQRKLDDRVQLYAFIDSFSDTAAKPDTDNLFPPEVPVGFEPVVTIQHSPMGT